MERFNIGWWCARDADGPARLLRSICLLSMSFDTWRKHPGFVTPVTLRSEGYPERRGHDNSRWNIRNADGDGTTCPIPNPSAICLDASGICTSTDLNASHHSQITLNKKLNFQKWKEGSAWNIVDRVWMFVSCKKRMITSVPKCPSVTSFIPVRSPGRIPPWRINKRN